MLENLRGQNYSTTMTIIISSIEGQLNKQLKKPTLFIGLFSSKCNIIYTYIIR